MAAPRVLVTAGPTREHLDDVRFLTNASTGRMGHAIAREAARRGAAVTLVLGPSDLPALAGVRTVTVTSTQEMLDAARRAVRGADLAIFAAAPADWRPARRLRGKPPREAGERSLRLLPTTDVAAALARGKGARVHVGFALEVDGGLRRARRKMERKGFDAVVLNSPENLGAGGGEVLWVPREGEPEPLSSRPKERLARAVVARALRLLDPPGRESRRARRP